MGVQYKAKYGIGFKVTEPSSEVLEEYDFYFPSYLEDILDDTGYRFFKVGSDLYDDPDEEYYVVLDNSFVDDGLVDKCKRLKSFLKRRGLISESTEPSVVGGLHIY